MNLKIFRSSYYLFPLLLFILWQNGSCHGESPAKGQTPQRVTTGAWGGKDVRMEVSETGAQLQFSCSHGSIDEVMVLKNGHFSAKGTFTAEGPGPTREDGPRKQPAIYSGSVEEKTMTLTVKLAEKEERVGDFTLQLGQAGRVRRCY